MILLKSADELDTMRGAGRVTAYDVDLGARRQKRWRITPLGVLRILEHVLLGAGLHGEPHHEGETKDR